MAVSKVTATAAPTQSPLTNECVQACIKNWRPAATAAAAVAAAALTD